MSIEVSVESIAEPVMQAISSISTLCKNDDQVELIDGEGVFNRCTLTFPDGTWYQECSEYICLKIEMHHFHLTQGRYDYKISYFSQDYCETFGLECSGVKFWEI